MSSWQESFKLPLPLSCQKPLLKDYHIKNNVKNNIVKNGKVKHSKARKSRLKGASAPLICSLLHMQSLMTMITYYLPSHWTPAKSLIQMPPSCQLSKSQLQSMGMLEHFKSKGLKTFSNTREKTRFPPVALFLETDKPLWLKFSRKIQPPGEIWHGKFQPKQSFINL